VEILGELSRTRAPPGPPDLISNTIEDRLANIRLETSRSANLHAVESLERLQQNVLDQVLGIEEGPSEPGQTAARPGAQAGRVPGEELVPGPFVPRFRGGEEVLSLGEGRAVGFHGSSLFQACSPRNSGT
jgi:hypothetical protein